MTDDDMEVYVYQGNDGEEVPRSVEKLVVVDGVRTLPEGLCYIYHGLRKSSFPNGLTMIPSLAFSSCINLSEINIPITVKVIGEMAFSFCNQLKAIEFQDCNATGPHQLNTIGDSAFCYCESLERFKLPSSVGVVGTAAFQFCE